MPSTILSRFLPPAAGEPSIYETLRQYDESSDHSDLEERAAMILDEENLGAAFHDQELDDVLAAAVPSTTSTSRAGSTSMRTNRHHTAADQSRVQTDAARTAVKLDDTDDDVPSSLLFEGNQDHGPGFREYEQPALPPIVHGQKSGNNRAKWRATQEQQRLYDETGDRPLRDGPPVQKAPTAATIDPREQAMWRWANVQNLDNFLMEVYDYFLGNGIWCILLSRGLNLLTLAFVVGFSTFLLSCIQYDKIPSSKTMSEILVPKCTKNMSGLTNMMIWLVSFLWICKMFQYVLDIRRLRNMHNFYQYLLRISDSEIQTVSWQEVVKRLMSLRDSNPATASGVSERHRRFMGSQSKQRMDAHDIANRLMRRDNYLIALINKDVLDLTLPLPLVRNRQLFSRTMEWNLSLCILDFVFNEQGQVRPYFLKDTHRRALSDSLRRRFMFAGIMNVLCAPFIFVYFLLLFFFRYFNEYQKNPSEIGSRQYTPFAEWKFREFNELSHLFQRRINMSYPFASRYLDQFPKDKTVQLSRFVAFVTGALASVLALASVVDPELFLGFEITPDRTVLFYLGVFGTVWAVARGGVPGENVVFDPEYTLKSVTGYTHYLPSHWRGRLHSDEVRSEFAILYKMKIVIFLEEMLSIILTPFVLWFSLPNSSDKIIDFFREFTVHVDGLGYVCSFAVFDFKKGATNQVTQDEGRVQDLRQDYYSTKDGKMLASYYGFIDNYVTNPRNGAPFPHPTKNQKFHPPPAFPGLMSPSLAADMGAGSSRTDRQDRQRGVTSQPRLFGKGTGHQSTYRTSKLATFGGHSSPMSSILLDPQHQPSRSAFRAGPKLGAQSRLRASRKVSADPTENEEEGLPLDSGQRGAGDSEGGLVDDSHLGDSWKTTRAGNGEDDGEENIQASNADRGPGVLGLVYQFSKAQTDGRGTGVNI